MATKKRRAPRFVTLHSADLDRKKRDVIIRFISDDGLQFTSVINEAIIHPLIATLLSQNAKLIRDPHGANIQPLTLTGAQKFAIHDGRSGLELYFDSGLKLPTLLPPKAIAGLQNELVKLQEIGAPRDPGSLPH